MKLKYTWIPFLLSIIMVIPFRIYQLSLSSGKIFSFDVNDNTIIGIFIYTVMFFSIIIICMSLFSKELQFDIKIEKNVLVSISLFLVGASAIAESLESFKEAFSGAQGNNMFGLLVLCILSAIASVVFFVLATGYFTGRDLFDKFPIMLIMPVVWLLYRLMISFIDARTVANNSVEMMGIITNAFLTLFVLYNAKMYIIDKNGAVVKKLFAFGLPSVAFALCYGIPNIYKVLFLDRGDTGLVLSSVTYIVMSIYIILLLLDVTKKCENKNSKHAAYKYQDFGKNDHVVGSPRAEESMLRKEN